MSLNVLHDGENVRLPVPAWEGEEAVEGEAGNPVS